MVHTPSSINGAPHRNRRRRPRTSLRVRNVAEGVVYHLVFEGDVQRLSGRQLRHHLAQICHIPPAEQLLYVHGAAFPSQVLGAAVGLQQEDTVDLVRGSDNNKVDGFATNTSSFTTVTATKPNTNPSPLPKQHRGYSAATASSLRPSTDAGTLSPETAPCNNGYDGLRNDEQNTDVPTSPNMKAHRFAHVPGAINGAAGAHVTSSVGSNTTSNNPMAPSPDRLIESIPQEQQPAHQRRNMQAVLQPLAAETCRPPRTIEGPFQARAPPLKQQNEKHPYNRSMQNDSQLPLWTSATTLSSFPAGHHEEDDRESPRPHIPSRDPARRVSLQQQRQQRPLTSADRSPLNTSANYYSQFQNGYHRASYEVPSPSEQLRRQPPSQQPPNGDEYYDQETMGMHTDPYMRYSTPQQAQQYQKQQHGARDGLNQSRMDRVQLGRGSASRPRAPSPLQPPFTSSTSSWDVSAPPPQHRGELSANAPARYIPVRADDLETLLDEQDYIWRMEEYRFRTERLNRLTALQNRQRELAFEATRYDQAVAVVSSQLQRERQKLKELQEAISHHTNSLNVFSKRSERSYSHRVVRRDAENGYAADDSEVIEVDF